MNQIMIWKMEKTWVGHKKQPSINKIGFQLSLFFLEHLNVSSIEKNNLKLLQLLPTQERE